MTNQAKALFYSLLILSWLIETTYRLGVASKPYILKAAAAIYVITLYTIEAAQYVYANRDVIRHRIESVFVYQSPTLVGCDVL